MNKYYLISSIFSAIFLIYLWLVWLPEYQYGVDPGVYQTQRTVAIIVSIAMLAVMVMTLFLAKSPVDEFPDGEKGEKGTTSRKADPRMLCKGIRLIAHLDRPRVLELKLNI